MTARSPNHVNKSCSPHSSALFFALDNAFEIIDGMTKGRLPALRRVSNYERPRSGICLDGKSWRRSRVPPCGQHLGPNGV